MSPRRRIDLLGLTRAELVESLATISDRRFRAAQIFEHVYRRGVVDFDLMTDLSLSLRETLTQNFSVELPTVVSRHASADGTEKVLLRLFDGAKIEVVDIPEGSRRTLCISSQAGCALGCLFCVTGYWGGGRNLSPGEIVGQVLLLRRPGQKSPAGVNLVFMGMGEPLLNLESIRPALEILTEFISWRRITISTVGILPAIEKLARWPKRPNLAVSLHAPDDERRTKLMPINRVYPLAELLTVLSRFPLEPGRKISLEYILIREFNDRPEDARELADLFSQLPVKINLIPLNPDPVLGQGMVPSEASVVDEFGRHLKAQGLVVTVRRRRGDDVSAACGQLRSQERDPRGYASRRLRI